MILIRWFLSYLTFFISIGVLGYLLINLLHNYTDEQQKRLSHKNDIKTEIKKEDIKVASVSKSNVDISQTIAPVNTIQEVKEDTREEIKEEAKIETEKPSYVIKQIVKNIDDSDLNQKINDNSNLSSFNKNEPIEDHKPQLRSEIKEILYKENNNLKKEILTSAEVIAPIVKADKKEKVTEKVFSNNKQTIDELVSLLMPDKHLFKDEFNNKKEKNNPIEYKWQLARSYFMAGKFKESEQLYLELIKQDADFADFYGELSNLYFVNNEIKKYNATLLTLARLYIKNKNIKMARYIIRLLEKTAVNLSKMLNNELEQSL